MIGGTPLSKRYFNKFNKIENLIFELTKNHSKRHKSRIRQQLKKLGVKDIDNRVASATPDSRQWWSN